MDDKSTQLPWEALQRAEGDIPWPALYNFAAAIVADPLVVDKLIDLYEQALDSDYGNEHYEEFYVSAIFALAAPQLSEQRRRELGTFLVQELAEAGRRDEDLLLEILVAASGSMGPVILPIVLETITEEMDHQGAWFHLWGLTELAAKSEDFDLRGRVIHACIELLHKADRGEIEPIDAIDAAWTLALMGCSDCRGLLRRLKKKSVDYFCHGDYADALDLLAGTLDYAPPPNLWEMPVKKWLEPRWKMAKDWYSKPENGNDEDDEATRRYIAEYNRQLMDQNPARQLEARDSAPPIPIVEHSPKTGRNEPCPCGSGKKYKKCCGKVQM